MLRDNPDLEQLIGSLLPDEEGMVRLSSEPLHGRTAYELPFAQRPIDVPGCKMRNPNTPLPTSSARNPPLIVSLRNPFSEGGRGVVSQRTARKVGFNGLYFRGQQAFPELSGYSSRIVRQAWPPGLLDGSLSAPTKEMEQNKCAPENWIARRPVGQFGNEQMGFKARYPPRNFLNALRSVGPRYEKFGIPTRTYDEPPFPVIPDTAAYTGSLALSQAPQLQDQSFSLCSLVPLSFSLYMIGDRLGLSDPWGQKRATIVSYESHQRYVKRKSMRVSQTRQGTVLPRTVEYFFRNDRVVKWRFETVLERELNTCEERDIGLEDRNTDSPGGIEHIQFHLEQRAKLQRKRETEKRVWSQLFEEQRHSPEGLREFVELAMRDEARYERDLQS